MSEESITIDAEHLPFFAAGPGQTDWLFVAVTLIMITVVLLVGVFYFKLHSLPEHMADGVNTSQLQVIGLLSLVALFTHNNSFWIAALLLAAIKIPDIVTPLNSIAKSLAEKSGD